MKARHLTPSHWRNLFVPALIRILDGLDPQILLVLKNQKKGWLSTISTARVLAPTLCLWCLTGLPHSEIRTPFAVKWGILRHGRQCCPLGLDLEWQISELGIMVLIRQY